MAEDEELAFGSRRIGGASDVQMITAIVLRDAANLHTMFAPFGGDDFATAVGVGFSRLGDSARTNSPRSCVIAVSLDLNHCKGDNLPVDAFIAVLC